MIDNELRADRRQRFCWICATVCGLSIVSVIGWVFREKELDSFRLSIAQGECSMLARATVQFYEQYHYFPKFGVSFEIDNAYVEQLAGIAPGMDRDFRPRMIDIPSRWLPAVLDPWRKKYKCEMNGYNNLRQGALKIEDVESILVTSQGRASAEVRIQRKRE